MAEEKQEKSWLLRTILSVLDTKEEEQKKKKQREQTTYRSVKKKKKELADVMKDL